MAKLREKLFFLFLFCNFFSLFKYSDFFEKLLFYAVFGRQNRILVFLHCFGHFTFFLDFYEFLGFLWIFLGGIVSNFFKATKVTTKSY